MSAVESQPEDGPDEKLVGLAPGTVLYLGEGAEHAAVVREALYGPDSFTQRNLRAGESLSPPQEGLWRWIHVTGVHDLEVLASLGAAFRLHPLVLEDIASTQQRAKFEEYDDYLFVTVRWLEEGEPGYLDEQVSILLGRGWLLSFQEREESLFKAVEDRLDSGKGYIRKLGPGYLAYALLDTVADQYFFLAEGLDRELELLEEAFDEDSRMNPLHRIQGLKRRATMLRRAVLPMRDIAGKLERVREGPFGVEGAAFLRDLQDHCAHILETAEHMTEAVGWLQQLYLSAVNTRLNRVIHVLTVVATIFIPLTFITGLYGMNFEHMPELGWPLGYPACLAFMAALAGGMYWFFRRKTWL